MSNAPLLTLIQQLFDQQGSTPERIDDLITREPNRLNALDISCDQLRVNLSRNTLPLDAIGSLAEAIAGSDLNHRRECLMAGTLSNTSEQRPVQHVLLRATESHPDSMRADTLNQVARALNQLHADQVKTLLVVGIGGSSTGPQLVMEALGRSPHNSIDCHLIDNLDAHHLHALLETLDSDHLRVCLVSKSFSTQETLMNARLIADWLSSQQLTQTIAAKFMAVTSKPELAEAFGIELARIFPMAQGVGGRFSLWSTVGLPIAAYCGLPDFTELLDGAEAMDRHFHHTPWERNIPVLMALIGVWYRHPLASPAWAVAAYDDRLSSLVPWLQQLDMESNGKRVSETGELVPHQTGPICFGGVGTGAQHAFFQWLHQGTTPVPVDFIGVRQPDHPHLDQHRVLLMNLLAQSEALMMGQSVPHDDSSDGLHREYPGNRPSNLVFLESMSPRAVGNLLAMYEHKITMQGWLWSINSFDQWGVELGKSVCRKLMGESSGSEDVLTRVMQDWLDPANL